jgi:hypothetical protein
MALAPGIVPLSVSDPLAAYAKALLTHHGEWVEQRQEGKRRRKRRHPPPIHPQLPGALPDGT